MKNKTLLSVLLLSASLQASNIATGAPAAGQNGTFNFNTVKVVNSIGESKIARSAILTSALTLGAYVGYKAVQSKSFYGIAATLFIINQGRCIFFKETLTEKYNQTKQKLIASLSDKTIELTVSDNFTFSPYQSRKYTEKITRVSGTETKIIEETFNSSTNDLVATITEDVPWNPVMTIQNKLYTTSNTFKEMQKLLEESDKNKAWQKSWQELLTKHVIPAANKVGLTRTSNFLTTLAQHDLDVNTNTTNAKAFTEAKRTKILITLNQLKFSQIGNKR